MPQIIEYHHINSNQWDSYVLNHPKGTIFQVSSYLNCHSSHFKSDCFGFAAIENGNIIGIVAGVITYNYFFPINHLTRRAVIEGGPLADNDETAGQLIKAVADYTERRTIYTQYRNLWNMDSLRPVLEEHGYSYEPHLDIIHDLTLEEDAIIKNVSKSKRGNIHKSLNKGTIFREASLQEWDRCIDLILGTYKRVGLPCQSKGYFLNAFKTMSVFVRVFVAELDGIIIGTRVELCYKDLVYDWYAGADDNYKKYYPNDVLPYSILLWGKTNEYKKFDFGGAGKPGVPYGVRDHKIKFGGNLVEYGRFIRICNKPLYNLGSLAVKLMKKR